MPGRPRCLAGARPTGSLESLLAGARWHLFRAYAVRQSPIACLRNLIARLLQPAWTGLTLCGLELSPESG
eukprot:1367297-Lingulodinium_polyedra.AAC.1